MFRQSDCETALSSSKEQSYLRTIRQLEEQLNRLKQNQFRGTHPPMRAGMSSAKPSKSQFHGPTLNRHRDDPEPDFSYGRGRCKFGLIY